MAFVDTIGLTQAVSEIKTFCQNAFSALGHKHSASDITSGQLAIERGGTGASTDSDARTNLSLYSRAEIDQALSDLEDAVLNAQAILNAVGTVPIANGGTGASTASGAKANIVDGQSLSPASVTATGKVKAATIEDSGGTLAALRESVSKDTSSISVTANAGWTVTQGAKRRLGNVCSMYITLKPSSGISANSTINPVNIIGVTSPIGIAASNYFFGHIAGSGVYARSYSALVANTAYDMTLIFVAE